MNQSKIQECFENSTIFLTGATGFIGNLLLAKILKTTNVKRIYLLIRTKTGKKHKTPEQRFAEIFDSPAFDIIKATREEVLRKVELFQGDLSEENLGFSEKQIAKLHSEVDIVLHCGATVKFTEPIEVATKINVRGTRDLLRIAKGMTKLRVFLHVSTAYTNCNRTNIDEMIYEPRISPHKLISVVDNLGNLPETLHALTPSLLGDWPNTYTFSKQLAEDLVNDEEGEIPVCIVRPSSVTSAVKEPDRGFVNNILGVTGVVLAISLGYLRVLHASHDTIIDCVPVDRVVNTIIAAAWNTMDEKAKKLKVYNCTSGAPVPLTPGKIATIFLAQRGKQFSNFIIWYPFLIITKCKYYYKFLLFTMHALPIYIAAFLYYCIGKKPWFLKVYRNNIHLLDVLNYFMNNSYIFGRENMKMLIEKQSDDDKELYDIRTDNIDYENYLIESLSGGRTYLIKEPPFTEKSLKYAQIRYWFLYTLHNLSIVLLLYFAYFILKKVFVAFV